ncbi:hypothetical protein GEV33_003445 [Tenebrio molitor]|uniref:Uncharacterized protein n=1 Tax=Tenebrio molitor TaxID=7067 RepID=A0A8J6HRB7_TENMO|nr:hypothetical protein GEV33_003445 [Tenebrio molitor]
MRNSLKYPTEPMAHFIIAFIMAESPGSSTWRQVFHPPTARGAAREPENANSKRKHHAAVIVLGSRRTIIIQRIWNRRGKSPEIPAKKFPTLTLSAHKGNGTEGASSGSEQGRKTTWQIIINEPAGFLFSVHALVPPGRLPWIVRAAATAESICVSAQKIDRIQSSPEERRRCVMYLANLPSG